MQIEKIFSETVCHAAYLMSAYFKKPVRFSRVVQMSESNRRNVILRLYIDNPTTKMPLTLILKKNAIQQKIFDHDENETELEQHSRFAHDWAGIEFLTQIGGNHAPHFYAGSIAYQFIIIEDLGLKHSSLVGPLTRVATPQNRDDAKAALISYVRRLGAMHADTAGKEKQFSALLDHIYPDALRFNYIPQLDNEKILNQLKKLIDVDFNELSREINAISEFSRSKNEFNVLLHGDICPDNVYYEKNNMRLIDFEFGDFGNALIDAVYLRMYMPSCWCSKAIPKKMVDEMESIYRSELIKGIPSASDDLLYNKQLVYACGYWLLRTIKQIGDMDLMEHERICPSGPIDLDSQWNPEENKLRPRILSRLDAFIACKHSYNYLPKLCEAAILLKQHLKKLWTEANEMDLFPAFK